MALKMRKFKRLASIFIRPTTAGKFCVSVIHFPKSFCNLNFQSNWHPNKSILLDWADMPLVKGRKIIRKHRRRHFKYFA